VAKGWSVNATAVYETDMPENIGLPGGGPPWVPTNISGIEGLRGGDTLNTVAAIKGPKTNKEWFNINAFGYHTPGTLGNERSNPVYGPNQRHVDFAMGKEFPFYEATKLQFRAEAFNLTNTANFGEPNLTYGPPASVAANAAMVQPTYDMITTTQTGYNPRLIQFALKLSF
jgi:hypothetical protein